MVDTVVAEGDDLPVREFRLRGGNVPFARVIQMTGKVLLVEVPTAPPRAFRSRTHIEFRGLRGIAVVGRKHPAPDTTFARYEVRVIALDEGLLEAIADATESGDCTVNVTD
jgi:hypothetical protein